MKQSLSIAFVLAFAFFLPVRSVEAQFTCTGTVCRLLPSDFTSPLNSTFAQIQTQYLNEVMKTNTEAAFLANLGANNMGTGVVRRIQVGTSLSAAAYQKSDITIQSDTFRIPALPNVGANLVPAITVDLNPGWLLGYNDRHWSRRFGIFLHGMRFGMGSDALQRFNSNDNIDARIAIKNYGGMIRYQLVEKEGFLANLITWNGLNVGLGHHFSETDFNLKYSEDRATSIESRGLKGQWGGSTNFDFNTKAKTTHVDLRTGFGFFYMLELIVGGGYSWNSGDSDISFGRTGPFTIQTSGSPLAALPANFASTLDPNLKGITEGGTLGLNARGESAVRRRIGYGIIGLELDIYLVKVVLEGLYGGKDLYSANLGVKVSF